MNHKVGDIIEAEFQPKNKWEILKIKGSVVKIRSLISQRETYINLRNNYNFLPVFIDGRRYDFERNKILPPYFDREIKNISDLMELAAHYGIKDII